MSKLSHQTGQQKEQLAAQWLQQQGIQLLEQNFRIKGGEIDLIGLDAQKTLIFFEVTYRQSVQYGYASEFVSTQKQARLIKCAQVYLIKHPHYQNQPQRFDVITFEAQQTQPNWIQNAFSTDGF